MSGEFSRYGCFLCDLVGECVFVVLDNGFVSFVVVVCSVGFIWCDGGVVDEFE